MVIFKIRNKFSISFSKNLAKTERIIQTNLENRIKTLEQNFKNEEDFYAYNLCELELENIYDKKAEGAKIRSKCEWYQHGEKPTKLFLNLEKQKAINTTVRHSFDDDKVIADLKEIKACICKFYKNLFKKNVSKSDSEKKSFLNSIALPNLISKSFDVDTKIFSKSLTEKLTNVLPELIASNQTAYVKNRCISESGRLISDVIEMCDILNISGYLVAMDIEKAFDSLDHDFLLSALKKFGFGENFIHWIKVLLNKQQSWVINGGFTTRYLNLE